MQTNSITLPPSETIGAASLALIGETTSLARQHAINKATLYMLRGCCPVATTGGFLIESATRGGIIHRVSNTNGCSCEAGSNAKPCWHAAMVEILEYASQHYAVTMDSAYEQALAEVNELFA